MDIAGEVGLHLYLTRGMARRFGVNLTEAMHEGLLTRRDFATLITRCRDCEAGATHCHATLATASDGTGAVPAWCPNRDTLDALGAVMP